MAASLFNVWRLRVASGLSHQAAAPGHKPALAWILESDHPNW